MVQRQTRKWKRYKWARHGYKLGESSFADASKPSRRRFHTFPPTLPKLPADASKTSHRRFQNFPPTRPKLRELVTLPTRPLNLCRLSGHVYPVYTCRVTGHVYPVYIYRASQFMRVLFVYLQCPVCIHTVSSHVYCIHLLRDSYRVCPIYRVYPQETQSGHVPWARARLTCIMRSQIHGIKRWAAGVQQGQ